MCGILGIYNLSQGVQIDQHLFESSLDLMNHRGPDSKNVKQIDNDLILGHLRLSIIDLRSESNQPFQIDSNYWIVFNGEIYNYLELRSELKKYGYEFKTDSDTEVLLRSFQHWGESCVNRFNGMWAFVIYNKVDKILFCSRDRFGVKPFNYSFYNDQFIFSSEVKSILNYYPNLKKPNFNVIANFCRTSIGAQISETWFENVKRLPPAHNISIHNGVVKLYRYWDYPRKINTTITFNQALDTYKYIFHDSINLRMRSDVPVGFTLSSGIDSNSLVYSLRKNSNINTYTAAFNPLSFRSSEKKNFKSEIQIDEAAIVRRVTDEIGMNANIIDIDYTNYVSKLQKIIYYLESGHGSPAVFPLFQVLERAKKDITVVLEGQGADELLGGYISNVIPVYVISLIKKFQPKKALSTLKIFLNIYSFKSMFLLFFRNFNSSILEKLYFKISGLDRIYLGKVKKYKKIKDYPNEPRYFNDDLNKHLYKAHTGGLVNLLHYGDAISMAHSLESRLPFMDYRLVEFVFSLPPSFKIKNGMGKHIHRVAMENVLPNYILNNPYKFGFDSPLSNLYASTESNSPRSILLSKRCIDRGLFSKNVLEKYFQDQVSGKKDNSRLLYRLLSVELWFREFID